jgi:hypothetical protein
MDQETRRGRTVALFLIVALALCIAAPVPAFATTKGGTGDNGNGTTYNGPVFLILSLEDEFDTSGSSDCDCQYCDCGEYSYPALSSSYSGCDYCECEEPGSLTYMVKIGTYVAAKTIGGTRFTPASGPTVDPSDGLSSYYGNQLTILGAFDTKSPTTVHLVSPDPADPNDPMPRKVQEAFFHASPLFETDLPGYPEVTTVEIAQFILQTAAASDDPDNPYFLGDQSGEGGEPPLTEQAILDNIFVTEEVLEGPDEGDVYAEADGDLYPHEPEDGALFGYSLEINSNNGNVTANVCLTVEIDIKPGNAANVVNYKSQGVVWAAVLSTADFDAPDEVDWDTAYLGMSPAKAYKVKDANKDGYDDLLLKFDVAKIGLTKDTTEVELKGDLTVGCFAGTDLVTTVPPKGKKK